MKFETKVTDIIQRTYNVKSVRFPRPASFQYKPGQFMFITIKSEQDELLKKHFTISSSPTEREVLEFTKKLTDHPFSRALNALRVSDWASIDGPYGDFTFEGQFEKIGLLSGGIGITPLRSICKYCLDTRSRTKIALLYGNRAEEDIVFRDEFEDMQKLNSNFRVAFVIAEANDRWTGYTGRIDADMIRKEIPDYVETTFYTCGPLVMVEAMEKLLKELDVPEKQIKTEKFLGF
ncbi:MAG: FAD-binding oxidoreductase [Candidatus Bathyarchaeia archaeon]|jgi:ferredoxin-NADP reductase